MNTSSSALPPPSDRLLVTELKLSPTDISQYIRLTRCERFLRLRMHERNAGRRFLTEYDVAPQAITPLLSRSGAVFEDVVEAALRVHFGSAAVVDFAADPVIGPRGKRLPDNERLVNAVRNLAPGERLVVCQPRLQVTLGAWSIRGDADLLRFEREAKTGELSLLVTDMKSSTAVTVEHRLQVAFYHVMLDKLFKGAALSHVRIGTAILYRGGDDPDVGAAAVQAHQASALARFGMGNAFLEVVADTEAYLSEVDSLVTGAKSDALRIAIQPFDSLFFSLGLKCDGCLYNEFCMKDAHERADIALVPYLPPRDRKALVSAGVRTIPDLARLKEFAGPDSKVLVSTIATDATVRKLASTTAGPRLDELVLRARATRLAKSLGLRGLSYLPSHGHTTLPFSGPEHNPNLVRIYVDAQHDYLHNRVYLVGALVVANENGQPARRRHIVNLTDGPPDTARAEGNLFAGWIRETLQAVVELAYPNAQGEPRAPLHLIFWNDFGQKLLLDALTRNMTPMVIAAPALYDFVTQIAAFDSPIATFLDEEIRAHKNYPMFCQSLQAVSQYLKFPWNQADGGGEDFRKIFHERLFDLGGRGTFERDGEDVEEFYERRSRHNSQVPLEYAYAAWDRLDFPLPGTPDNFVRYRDTSAGNLTVLQERRLDAVEWIADTFQGNRLTEKTSFLMPDLSTFRERAEHLGQALSEFGTIERHVYLAEWKAVRQLAPERRVLLGETLLARYVEADQDVGVAAQNRDNAHRKILRDRYYAEYKIANPSAKQVRLSANQNAECKWSMEGMHFHLRIDLTGIDADLGTVLDLLNLKEGDRFILYPRWTTDERLPEADRTPNTPTPKQMLYGTRVELVRVIVEKNLSGLPISASAEVSICGGGGGGSMYLFSAIDRPLELDALYTLDPDPNNIYGFWQAKVCGGLCNLESVGTPEVHTLYERVAHRDLDRPADWPNPAAQGQVRFLAGLDAYHAAGLLHDFEIGKRDYIGAHGGDPVLLVQGPPGTGKSYSTAFAVLARMQGAWAGEMPSCRVFLSCKTHSATDVLLRGVAEVLQKMERLKAARPDIWSEFFDSRLLGLPLLRIASGRNSSLPNSVQILAKDNVRGSGEGKLADDIAAEPFVIIGATPGGIYGMINARWPKAHFGHYLCDLLVLDEASQMSLPEAMMASLPLDLGGRVIVVGDPRQMPPIVQHAWETEPRRTFQEFKSYESLFNALAGLGPPFIRFEESFRLHGAMAKFLRDEIYIKDGIDYHSHRTKVLGKVDHADPFVAAVLDPACPLVVIVHDEAESQSRNAFEEKLIGPVLRALADPQGHGLTARDGLGIVVPHRAQRVALRKAFPELCLLDQETGEILVEAVDTVERYQGEEREVILVSATESDPEYLQASAGFLLDPRRLTVALSRAKRKMILIASRTIFNYFSPDEETFLNAQLWKNLLRRTCTVPLWQGEQDGRAVEVWGHESGGQATEE